MTAGRLRVGSTARLPAAARLPRYGKGVIFSYGIPVRPADPELVKEYAFRVWKYKEGEVVSLAVYLGDRLGLYQAMAGGEPFTPAALAERTGLDERWLREWLLCQAAAGLVARTCEGVYSLEPEGEQVLVDASSLVYAAGVFSGGFPPDRLDGIVESFRTGLGIPYGEMGDRMAREIDRMHLASLGDYLVDTVLARLDGVVERLEAGAAAADVGCGGAIAVETLARRFPASSVVGYEPSPPAAARARRRLDGLPNASVVRAFGEDLPADARYDLILTMDCLHDMPFPDRVAAAIRRAVKPDGVWLIKDMKCSEEYEENRKNPVLAMQYGFSLAACLSSGTSAGGRGGPRLAGLHPRRGRAPGRGGRIRLPAQDGDGGRSRPLLL